MGGTAAQEVRHQVRAAPGQDPLRVLLLGMGLHAIVMHIESSAFVWVNLGCTVEISKLCACRMGEKLF